MATTMHNDLTKANLNVWHLWWLYENNGSGCLYSAYINPVNDALSIVAINSNTSSASASFFISTNAPCSLTPYETSAANSLGQLPLVTVSNSRVRVTLAAQSVTTFVGTL